MRTEHSSNNELSKRVDRYFIPICTLSRVRKEVRCCTKFPNKRLFSLRAIKKGEEITTLYLDTNDSQERRRRLRKRYLFECNCVECAREMTKNSLNVLTEMPDSKLMELLVFLKKAKDFKSAISEILVTYPHEKLMEASM